VQTTRLAESFELLTGSVPLTGPEKFPCKATYDPAVFVQRAWFKPAAKVLRLKHRLYYFTWLQTTLVHTESNTFTAFWRHLIQTFFKPII